MYSDLDQLNLLLQKARATLLPTLRGLLGEHQLSEQQWRILKGLHVDPASTAQDLSSKIAIMGPSLSKLLTKLEANDLIVRQPNPQDFRSKHLTLSQKGLALVARIDKNLNPSRSLPASLSPTELNRLVDLLQKIIDGRPD